VATLESDRLLICFAVCVAVLPTIQQTHQAVPLLGLQREFIGPKIQ
jgi:hypothetical protein